MALYTSGRILSVHVEAMRDTVQRALKSMIYVFIYAII